LSSFSIDISFPPFMSELKAAKKKFPTIKNDLAASFAEIEQNPKAGDHIPRCGEDLYKLRIGVKGQMGKRGGYRMIYHVSWTRKLITPIALYFKADTPNLSESEVTERFGKVIAIIAPSETRTVEASRNPPPPEK
jgi:mRNA-degrading endonuclease RelE of RelBE toxin-antitoxin system